MSLNELLIGSTTSKPWCNLVVNDVKSGSATISGLSANQVVGTDGNKQLVSTTIDSSTFMTIADVQTATGKKTFSGGAPILGVSDASNAAAGYIGEYADASFSDVAPSASNTYYNLASLPLTAGDWDITYTVLYNMTDSTVLLTGISTTATANSFPDQVKGVNTSGASVTNAATLWNEQQLQITSYRVSISASTTYYLKSYSTYATTAPRAWGRISARRMR
jgi:hypothetical protein